MRVTVHQQGAPCVLSAILRDSKLFSLSSFLPFVTVKIRLQVTHFRRIKNTNVLTIHNNDNVRTQTDNQCQIESGLQ